MKSFVSTVASVAALAGSVYAQSNLPIINTPAAVVQCQPALIQFSGGTAPYFLSVLPGGQAGATPIELLPDQPTAGSFTWTVNIPAGTAITLQVRDGAGQINYASIVTVQDSNDSSCLGQAASGTIVAGGQTSAATATGTGAGRPTSAAATTSAAASGSTALTSTAATATVTAGSGTPANNVSTTNGTTVDPEDYNFTCTRGELSYAITVAELDIPLEEATAFFSNWTGAVPGTLVNSTGTGVNSTRAYTLGANVTLNEELLVQQMNMTSGSLHQQWNLTEPVTLAANLTVFSAFQDLTVYTNETTNNTNAQWFILACPSSQAAGLPALTAFVDAGIAGFQSKIAGANSTTTPTAAPTAASSGPARFRARWM